MECLVELGVQDVCLFLAKDVEYGFTVRKRCCLLSGGLQFTYLLLVTNVILGIQLLALRLCL